MIADIYPEYVRYFVLNQTNYPELSHQSYILTLQHTPAGISLSDFRAFPETPHMFFVEQAVSRLPQHSPRNFFSVNISEILERGLFFGIHCKGSII